MPGPYQVRVNGDVAGTADQLSRELDITGRLVAGDNVLEVVVATPLLNRLRVHRPAEYGSVQAQDYGLVGPVTLSPAVLTPLRRP